MWGVGFGDSGNLSNELEEDELEGDGRGFRDSADLGNEFEEDRGSGCGGGADKEKTDTDGVEHVRAQAQGEGDLRDARRNLLASRGRGGRGSG